MTQPPDGNNSGNPNNPNTPRRGGGGGGGGSGGVGDANSAGIGFRVPPHSNEAEASLLGSILLDNSAIDLVLDMLTPEDFYQEANRKLFTVMREMYGEGKAIDTTTVFARLAESQSMEAVGGVHYVLNLTNRVPSASNIEHYAEIVRDKGLLRRLIYLATQVSEQAYHEVEDVPLFLDTVERQIFSLSQQQTRQNVVPMSEIIKETFRQIEQLHEKKDKITGVSTGFLELDDLTAGFQPSDLIILAARPSMGKCVGADTEVLLADGRVETIEAIVRSKKADLVSLNAELRLVPAKASAFIDDGIKPLFEVTTQLGRQIKTTLTHPFLTVEGWRPLGELSVGDMVAVPRNLPFFGQRSVGLSRMKLLGYLLGDGNLTNNSPRFTNQSEMIQKDFENLVCEWPGLQVTTCDSNGQRTTTLNVVRDPAMTSESRQTFAKNLFHALTKANKSRAWLAAQLGVSAGSIDNWCNAVTVPSDQHAQQINELLEYNTAHNIPGGLLSAQKTAPHAMTAWLTSLGLMGLNAHQKHIPQALFEAPKEELAALLNRLFSTDGWATVLSSGQPQLGYATVSPRLAHQIQHLLLRFGVIASLRQRKIQYQGTTKQALQLNITDATSITRFIEHIGIFAKEDACQKILHVLTLRRKQTNRDLIPVQIWSHIQKLKGDTSWSQISQQMGYPPTHSLHVGTRALSRERCMQFAQFFNDPHLRYLATSDVYWDSIVSITPLGPQQVYDLTVDDTHNFVANDICVHNTAFSLGIMAHAALRVQCPVAYFSLEMSKEQLAMRLLCSEAQVDASRLRGGFLNDGEWRRLIEAAGKIASAPIYIDDTAAMPIMKMQAVSRRLKTEKNIGMIMVDYLQLMRADALGKNASREQIVSEISRNLKAIAKELRVPVVALSQLNRGLESRTDKRPLNSDLRESGSIEQDADVIMFIYRDEVYNKDSEEKGIAEIIISKQRNGPLGTARLKWMSGFTRFDNLAREEGGVPDF